MWTDEERRERTCAATARYVDRLRATPEGLAKLRMQKARSRANAMADPVRLEKERARGRKSGAAYRAKVKADPELYERHRRRSVRRWAYVKADPELLEQNRASSVAYHARVRADPVLLEKRRAQTVEYMARLYADPELHEKYLAQHRRNVATLKADPVRRDKFRLRQSASFRKHGLKTKAEAFALLGGVCAGTGRNGKPCKEDRIDAIEFDHINDDGRSDRGKRTANLVLKDPRRFQPLCGTCHRIKTNEVIRRRSLERREALLQQRPNTPTQPTPN